MLFVVAAINLFFPPTPLETITLFAAYLSAEKVWTPLIIIGATAGGMFVSSLLLYRLTQTYGASLIEKPPLNKIITDELYQKALRWFEKYGLYIIYLGKLVPGMTLYTILCCGLLNRQNAKVLWPIFFSNLFFFFILVMIGRQLGVHWGKALPWVKKVGLFSLTAMIIFTLVGAIQYLINLKKEASHDKLKE